MNVMAGSKPNAQKAAASDAAADIRSAMAGVRVPKHITVLGATGSIGEHTALLLQQYPDDFVVEAVTAHTNAKTLAKQAIQLKAKRAVIADASRYSQLKEYLSGTEIEVLAGEDALCEVASIPVDIVVSGIVGFSGLRPTLAAIEAGNHIALANKECLVAAGALCMRRASQSGSRIIPVDSEHSAIFQLWDEAQRDAIEKVVLTASGGPFHAMSQAQMHSVTPEQAVAHPNWSMGAKISVDSATMMNKGLELIEAHHLFALSPEKLEVLVHPESVVHSLVHYQDGSVLAQLGMPDMCTPIAVALAWPHRIAVDRPKLNLAEIGQLHFSAPDTQRFPCLQLAVDAMAAGGAMPAILNAANEVAVAAFLKKELGFLEIAHIVSYIMEQQPVSVVETLADTLALDKEVRCKTQEAIQAKRTV